MTTDEAFYEDPQGLNYAQARYLCYWLQERGLLVKFFRRAQELKEQDRTGLKALTEVLGEDPDKQWAEWARYVRSLGPGT